MSESVSASLWRVRALFAALSLPVVSVVAAVGEERSVPVTLLWPSVLLVSLFIAMTLARELSVLVVATCLMVALLLVGSFLPVPFVEELGQWRSLWLVPGALVGVSISSVVQLYSRE